MSKSIIQQERECYLCRYLYNFSNVSILQEHHIFFGTANRRLSEEYGLKLYLCINHHTEGLGAVHKNKDFDILLKKIAQKKFEEKYGHEKFMEVFKKNYL